MYCREEPAVRGRPQAVGDALQGALVDLVDLSLVAKQIHWNVVGPRFRSVHLQLDEVVDTARTHSDTVAERASALGVAPDGRAATVAEQSGIGTVPEGWIKDADAVRTLVDALGAVIARMRERIAATDEPDPVSQDILIGITRGPGEASLDVPGGERMDAERESGGRTSVRSGSAGRGPRSGVAQLGRAASVHGCGAYVGCPVARCT